MSDLTGDAVRPGGLKVTAWALERAHLVAGAHVADVGCGLGATVAFLEERGFVATGIDPSPVMLARARALRPCLDLRAGSAEALPLADGAVDGVFVECTLSLVGDRMAALREIHRVLRPGGRLIVSDLYRRRDASVPASGHSGSCLDGVGSRDDVCRLLKSGGFDVSLWQDETPALAELAATIVFAHGSLRAFFDAVGQAPVGSCDRASARDLGYFVAVATRAEAHWVAGAGAGGSGESRHAAEGE